MSGTEYHRTLPSWEPAVYDDERLPPPFKPGTYLWSGKSPPPAIGETVKINFNDFGTATVTGYFTEYKWLGVTVKLHHQPEWHRKQNGAFAEAHVFGAEINQ